VHLISRILDIVDLDQTEESSRNTKDTPAVKPLFIKDTNGEKRSLTYNYCSVIGILNYLSESTRPNISMAMQ